MYVRHFTIVTLGKRQCVRFKGKLIRERDRERDRERYRETHRERHREKDRENSVITSVVTSQTILFVVPPLHASHLALLFLV